MKNEKCVRCKIKFKPIYGGLDYFCSEPCLLKFIRSKNAKL